MAAGPSGIAASSSATFADQTLIGAGEEPLGLAMGDVNGDGNQDMVTADYEDATISLFLGDGNGGFGARTTLTTGIGPDDVELGDIDGDSDLDIVTSNYNDAENTSPDPGTISVLLNDGSGGFSAKTDYPTDLGPSVLILGHLNADDDLDVVTSNNYSDTVSVLLGDGAGGFGAPDNIEVGEIPYGADLGDLNNDGNLDIVTANYEDENLTVLLGDGDGTFDSGTTFPTTAKPSFPVIGDLNGDGDLDVTVPNYNGGTVSVLLGDGTGALGSKADYPTGASPWGNALGDVNGDGILDVAVTNYADETTSVLLGVGDGTFGARSTFDTGGYPYAIAMADLNGDRHLDMAVTNRDTDNVSILLNTTVFDQTITFKQPSGVSLADRTTPLSATATSGLAVSFTSDTPSVCIVSGAAAKLLKPGKCKVTARQSGSATWSAASAVSQSFTVSDPLVVKARKKRKKLKLSKRTKIVRSVTSSGKITKVKAICLLEGRKLKGADKRANCKITVRKTRASVSNAKVWVKPLCSAGLKVRVKVASQVTPASKSKWQRTWKVKGSTAVCSLRASG